MVDSRDDNIENFVNALVNKLVLEVMDILDAKSKDNDNYWHRFHVNCVIPGCAKCKDRKKRNLSLRVTQQGRQRVEKRFSYHGDQNRSSDMSEFPQTALVSSDLWTRDGNIHFDVDQRASDEIRKIVQGLEDVQIGDSAFVRPMRELSNLEVQVKRAVQEMSNGSEIMEIKEATFTEGQGDVDGRSRSPIAEGEVIDTIETSPEILEIVENDNNEDEVPILQRQTQQRLQQQHEVSKLRSTCFLHRIIKELENAEMNQENVLKVSTNSMSGISQERIAAWEENEEKFIRTIEGSKNEQNFESEIDDSFAISLVEDEVPAGSIVELEIQEINSRPVSPDSIPSPRSLTPAPANSTQCLNFKRDSMLPEQQDSKIDKSKMKNKIRFGEKLRRFFRSAFKRGKDC